MQLYLEVFGDVQLARELLRFGERAEDMSPAFEQIADDFLQIQEFQFDSQGGMFSGGWAALAPSTIESKRRQGLDPRILHATLALRNSLTNKNDPNHVRRITPDTMEVGTSVTSPSGFPYPAAHQNPKQGQKQRRPIELDEDISSDWVKVLQEYLVQFETGIG